ncbi:MAG: hypothetical protein MUE96_11970 [Bacteroidia bacterium]|jgi:RHS repeat-associated protein|nr:hypothetical protein [Bacteroidia bacterium]
MKAYVNLITPILLGVIFFGSCSTKKQVNTTANTATSGAQNPSTDTSSYEPLKQYYQPHLSYQLPVQQLNPKPVKLSSKDIYELALIDLKDMLEEKTELSFERAVFLSENPYNNGWFTYSAFQNSVTELQMVIQQLIQANDNSDTIEFDRKVNQYGRFNLKDLEYMPEERKELYRMALCNWAIFKYLTDTVEIYSIKDSSLFAFYHAPYGYSTSDPFGMKDWRHSQVMNLLISEENKGNCFALTALFKILSDRFNANSRICTAPQHIYIQHQDPKGQYYNVEMATAGHPGDGIIQTLTYTPTEGILSGIALRDYTTKQSIGLCIVNLAKSYERKFNAKDDEFLLRCAELALAHDSLNLNALLLKQQVLDTRVTKYAVKNGINSIQKLKQDTGIAKTALKLEKHLALLYNLGYREMPLDMQELIMNPFGYDPTKWNRKSQNARPFSSFEPPDPKDAEYWTLTKGMFKEIWEPTAKETYGHYTITTATGKLKAMDTTSQKGGLIDPVAFAYDFGARMYDARIGRFITIDPENKLYPELSPYSFVNNSPLIFVDHKGRSIKPANPDAEKLFTASMSTLVPQDKWQQVFNLTPGHEKNNRIFSSADEKTLTIKDFGKRAKHAGVKLKGQALQDAYSMYQSLSSKDIIELQVATQGQATTYATGEGGTVIVGEKIKGGYDMKTMANGQATQATQEIINGTSTDPVQFIDNNQYNPKVQMGTVETNIKGVLIIDQTNLKTVDQKKGALLEGLNEAAPAPRK